MGAFIGTSGWIYDHWTHVIYPEGIPQSEKLELYTHHFSTVEVNATFYRWMPARTFSGWQRRLPQGFRMTIKAPKFLTHVRRLYDPDDWMPRLATAFELLGDKAGCLLVQLPPGLTIDLPRLEYFCSVLPKSFPSAIEFRHWSWHTEETFQILERYGVAYCIMSGANLPCILRATANHVYVRFHGPDDFHLYAGSYPEQDLQWWAERIREWLGSGRDVWCYFNNDYHGYAVYNARRLKEILEV